MDTNTPTPEQWITAVEWLLSDEADDVLGEATDEEIAEYGRQVSDADRAALDKATGPDVIARLFAGKLVSREP